MADERQRRKKKVKSPAAHAEGRSRQGQGRPPSRARPEESRDRRRPESTEPAPRHLATSGTARNSSPQLQKAKFKASTTPWPLPRLEKIVISMGLGKIATAPAGADAKSKFGGRPRRSCRRSPARSPVRMQGQEVCRQLQGPRGPGDGAEGHAPRQADVRVLRPPDLAGHRRASRTSAASPPTGFDKSRQLQLRVHRADRLPRGRRRRRHLPAGDEHHGGAPRPTSTSPSVAASCSSSSASRSREQ